MGGSKQALGTCIFVRMSKGKTGNIQESHFWALKSVWKINPSTFHISPAHLEQMAPVPLLVQFSQLEDILETVMCVTHCNGPNIIALYNWHQSVTVCGQRKAHIYIFTSACERMH